MTIGSKIKKLRRESDMTQEQLAEYMNLSMSAVSQWECDKTMPDISQLPLLANIFEVSADELLGINIAKKEEKIKDVLDKAQKNYVDGDFVTTAEILRNGLHEFPSSYKIMERLADALICKFDGSTSEAISLCEKVLEGCTENDVRNSAVQTLCIAYKYAGRTEDAIRTAESQTAAWFSREDMLMTFYKGDKAIQLYNKYAMFCLNRLNSCINNLACAKKDDGNPAFNDCQAICLLEKIPVLLPYIF
jgi:transcriptional regulator with XRE-family HTH domain